MEKSQRLKPKLLVVSILVLVLSLNSNHGLWLPTLDQANAQATPKVAVDPERIADLLKTSGTVEFEVNLTDAPAINGFSFILTYNATILDALALDLSGNVLEGLGTLLTLRYCVDGLLNSGDTGTGCQSIDAQGVVSLALVILGSQTVSPTNGLLARITFNVIGVGFSQIHFRSATLSTGRQVDGKPEQISVNAFDGHFVNKACPDEGGAPCTPPNPVFTWSPLKVVEDRLITFNASQSSHPVPGATIEEYFWDWDDGKATISEVRNQTTGQVKNSTTHVFDQAATRLVTLKVTDNRRISWSKTESVTVENILIDLGIADVEASQSENVLPGSNVTVTATLRNLGVGTQNATLRISVEGSLLGETAFLNMLQQEERTLVVTWNTLGFRPRVYRVEAVTPLVTNSTTGMIVENATSNNAKSIWIQLIEPLPAGLGLGLWASAGLSALGVTGVVFALSRVRRKPTEEDMTAPIPSTQ